MQTSLHTNVTERNSGVGMAQFSRRRNATQPRIMTVMAFLFLTAAILGMHSLPPSSLGAPSAILAGAAQQSFHTESVIAPDRAPMGAATDGINADGSGTPACGQCSCSRGACVASAVTGAGLRFNVPTLVPSTGFALIQRMWS